MLDRGVLSGRMNRGRLLGGRYEVRSLIGRGGMAEVYEAMDRLLARRVAVKVVRDALVADGRLLARFRREARAAASLSHPNIVAVHDTGMEGDLPFLVMELVPGRSLAEISWDQAPLPPHRAATIAEQIAAALAYAHARGIVHRDVSPGNVMVTPGGDVKVLDFGIARVLSWTPVTGSPTRHGTAAYLSPEQARGGEADERSDVYALGAVLYEMLTGRPPFEGDGAVGIAYRHLHEEPVSPRALVDGIPPALDRAVMRCLAKDPDARYQRARDLRADLARIRAGAAGSTEPPAGSRPGHEADRSEDSTSRAGRHEQGRVPAATRRLGTRRLDTAMEGAGALGTTPLSTATRPDPRHRGGEAPRERRVALWAALGAAVLAAALALGLTLLPDRPAPGAAPSPDEPAPPPAPLFAPADVTAVAACDGFLKYRVDLSWTPTESAVATGYEILRSDDPGGEYQVVARIRDRESTSFPDRDLGAEAGYHYVIRAIAEGRRGPLSPEVAAETPLICLF